MASGAGAHQEPHGGVAAPDGRLVAETVELILRAVLNVGHRERSENP